MPFSSDPFFKSSKRGASRGKGKLQKKDGGSKKSSTDSDDHPNKHSKHGGPNNKPEKSAQSKAQQSKAQQSKAQQNKAQSGPQSGTQNGKQSKAQNGPQNGKQNVDSNEVTDHDNIPCSTVSPNLSAIVRRSDPQPVSSVYNPPKKTSPKQPPVHPTNQEQQETLKSMSYKDVKINGRLMTTPTEESIMIRSPTPSFNLNTILNSVAGQHCQYKRIRYDPGEYSGRYLIGRIASSVSIEGACQGLRVVGDIRPLSGLTFENDKPIYQPRGEINIQPSNMTQTNMTQTNIVQQNNGYPEVKLVSLQTDGQELVIRLSGEHLDFKALGVKIGDKLILTIQHPLSQCNSLSQESSIETSILEVNTVSLKYNIPGFQGKLKSVTFCPNVTFFVDDLNVDPLLTVVDTSITFKGIRFSQRKNAHRRALIMVIGKSLVNLLNCVVDDLSHCVDTCVSVNYGATLLSSEMINLTSSRFDPIAHHLSIIGGKNGLSINHGSTCTDGIVSVLSPLGIAVNVGRASFFYGMPEVLMEKPKFPILDFVNKPEDQPENKTEPENKP